MNPEVVLGAIGLIAADGAIYFAARLATSSAKAQSIQGFPLLWALALCLAAFVVHATTFMWAAVYMDDRQVALVLSILTGLAPAVALSAMLIESSSRNVTKMIYGGDADSVDRPDMSAAAKCLKAGDIEGAMGAYQEILREYPEFPDPLFAMQSLRVQQSRFQEASEICREIIRRFQSDDVIWTRACGLLSELLREQLDDDVGATAIDKAVRDRNPATEHGFLKGEAAAVAAPKHGRKSKAQTVHGMEQARRLVKRGEVDAAVDLYQQCQRERPSDPKPSLEAATALELDGQYQRAVDELQRAARAFSGDSGIWCELALRMAGVYSNHLGRPDAALDVLAEIKNRAPSQKLEQLAAERIAALKSATN